MNRKITAERLAKALSDARIGQRELAKKANIKESSISHYINGRHSPSKESAEAIAKVLDVNPAWLMGFDVPKEEKFSAAKQYFRQTDAVDSLFAASGWETEDILGDDEIIDYTEEGEPIFNTPVIGIKLTNDSYSFVISYQDYMEIKDTINEAFKAKFLEIVSKNLPSLIEE